MSRTAYVEDKLEVAIDCINAAISLAHQDAVTTELFCERARDLVQDAMNAIRSNKTVGPQD